MIRKLARTEDELHETAIRNTGFDDFGDPAYREGLRVLLEAFDSDLSLTEAGRQIVYDIVLRILTARLYTQRGWSEHPEVFAIPIRRPLVIVGLPRTGTTALHRLLSVDPQFQGLEYWLTQTPMIRPPRESWETYSEYRSSVAHIEALYTRRPELRTVHVLLASEMEECMEVLLQSCVSTVWSAAYGLRTYGRWFLSQSARDSYRRYSDVLRLIGARETHKRWLLKGVYHMAEIDALLEVFPDVCIIHTHRDPLKSIPSNCSLLYMAHRDLEGEAASPDVLGQPMCAYSRKALDCARAARQRVPMQFFDADHRRFLEDPVAMVYSIYEYFGLTLSPHVEQQMRAWVAASPTSRYGKHQYAIGSWGVTPAQIRETFADYRAQHHFN